jgi:hypothetical protein
MRLKTVVSDQFSVVRSGRGKIPPVAKVFCGAFFQKSDRFLE